MNASIADDTVSHGTIGSLVILETYQHGAVIPGDNEIEEEMDTGGIMDTILAVEIGHGGGVDE